MSGEREDDKSESSISEEELGSNSKTNEDLSKSQTIEFSLAGHLCFFSSAGQDKLLLVDGMIFGRGENCDVVLEDDNVSCEHFKVFVRDSDAYIYDFGSGNKTFLNGSSITPNKELQLKHGDIIQLGRNIYGYSTKGELDFHIPYASVKELDPTLSLILQTTNFDLEKPSIAKASNSSAGGKILHEMREVKRLLQERVSEQNEVKSKIARLESLEINYAELKQKRYDIRENFKLKKISGKSQISDLIDSKKYNILKNNETINEKLQQIAQLQAEIEELKLLNESYESQLDDHEKEIEEFEEFESVTKEMRGLKAEILELRALKKSNMVDQISNEMKDFEQKLKDLQAEYANSLDKSSRF